MNLQESIRRILMEDKKTKSTNKEFSKYKDSKFNTLRNYTLQDIVDNWDSLSDHKNENIKTIKHFINNPDKITDLVYDEKGLEDGYHRLIAAKILKKPRFSYRLVENLQESIRRILREVFDSKSTFKRNVYGGEEEYREITKNRTVIWNPEYNIAFQYIFDDQEVPGYTFVHLYPYTEDGHYYRWDTLEDSIKSKIFVDALKKLPKVLKNYFKKFGKVGNIVFRPKTEQMGNIYSSPSVIRHLESEFGADYIIEVNTEETSHLPVNTVIMKLKSVRDSIVESIKKSLMEQPEELGILPKLKNDRYQPIRHLATWDEEERRLVYPPSSDPKMMEWINDNLRYRIKPIIKPISVGFKFQTVGFNLPFMDSDMAISASLFSDVDVQDATSIDELVDLHGEEIIKGFVDMMEYDYELTDEPSILKQYKLFTKFNKIMADHHKQDHFWEH